MTDEILPSVLKEFGKFDFRKQTLSTKMKQIGEEGCPKTLLMDGPLGSQERKNQGLK